MKTLLLIADAALSHFDWFYFVSTTSQPQAQGQVNSLEQLPEDYQSSSIHKVLALAGTDIITHQINPNLKLSKGKLLQALPTLFEEDLLSDTEELMFKLVQPNKTQRYAIVLSKTLLHDIQEKVCQGGTKLDAIVPLSTLIPSDPKGCIILEHNDLMYTKCHNESSLVLEKPNFATLLDTILAKSKAEQLIAYVSDNEIKLSLSSKKGNGTAECDIQLNDANLGQVRWDLNLVPNINLLSTQQDQQERMGLGKLVHFVLIAALFIGLSFAYQIMQIKTLHDKLSNQVAENEKLYFALYPQADVMIDPRIRIESDLKRYKGAPQDLFLAIMAKLEKVTFDKNKVIIQSIRYQSKTLDIDITSLDDDDIQQFIQLIEANKLKTSIKSMTKSDDKILATIAIEDVGI